MDSFSKPLSHVLVRFLILVVMAGIAGCGGGNGGTNAVGGGGPSPTPVPLTPSRTTYVRTDAATEYFDFINRHWSVYSPLTNRLFVSDPGGNHVMVLDPTTRTKIATLEVPGAFGMDDTPDHTKIYVGTLIGDVYTIDPVAITVTGRFLASQIGAFGFQASIALVLSDGRLALLGAAGGIANVDGSTAFMVWNPVDNSSTIYQSGFSSGVGGPPSTVVCGPLGNIAAFTRSADRKRLLVGSAFSDSTLCQLDPATGAFNFTSVDTFPAKISVSPDGRFIATVSGGNMLVLDANSLILLAKFPVNGETGSDAWITFGPDSSTVFVTSQSFVYAYNVNTHQQIGWLPNLVVEPVSGGFLTGPASGPSIVDVGNGLLAGPMEQGVGFLDVMAMHTGTVGTQFLNGYLENPFGPVSGGTVVKLPDPNTMNSPVNSVYFGAQRAPSVTLNSGLFSITTPPGAPGPVDVEVLMNDGGAWILPEGFSYGPTIIEVTPNASTAEGGGTGIIYGYGFGPVANATIPSDLTVTVGGQPATLLGFTGNAYNVTSPPYQLEAVAFRIPAGTAGSSVSVTVSNGSGSATANAAFSYLPPAQTFAAGSTPLAQGIYDQLRDVYYFTEANQVQVFSKTLGRFLTPISIIGSQRLWGISLSPDGSKLAIADVGANAIYLLNPDTPAAVKTFSLALAAPGIISNPAGVAVSNAGMVYYAVVNLGGTGFHGFFKLDTVTGKFTDYNITAPGFGSTDALLRTAMSADGARVYFNSAGLEFTVDTATDTVILPPVIPFCCSPDDFDLALSSNNTRFAAGSFLFDADLNGESFLTANDREVRNISYVFGMKLSPDGTLLFQPSTQGIDVYDGRLGTLRSRIAMPFSFSAFYDALVADGKDNILVGIIGPSANAIAVIDLSSLPEPSPLPFAAVVARPPANFLSRAATGFRSSAVGGAPRSATDRFVNLPSRPAFGNRVPHVTPSAMPRTFWTKNGPEER
jgi:IPT/TIG domain-containing protein